MNMQVKSENFNIIKSKHSTILIIFWRKNVSHKLCQIEMQLSMYAIPNTLPFQCLIAVYFLFPFYFFFSETEKHNVLNI